MLFTKMPPVYVYDMVLKKRCCHVTATKLCDPRKCHQFTMWILRGLLPGGLFGRAWSAPFQPFFRQRALVMSWVTPQ